mmetsp:Transcript_23377/g.55259  ORF Transcript_23377/g.55259 Transcript_23377/m.55259 type:complete len:100 (+) Transcript_23377:52-351(+)
MYGRPLKKLKTILGYSHFNKASTASSTRTRIVERTMHDIATLVGDKDQRTFQQATRDKKRTQRLPSSHLRHELMMQTLLSPWARCIPTNQNENVTISGS